MTFGGFTPFTLIDYPGKTAAMVYTIGCNFRCPYCHNPELVDETVTETFSEETILSFLEKRRGLVEGLVVTGGEPTMHDDLLPFLLKVKALGFLVKLDTNGTNPDMVEAAIASGAVDYFAMDIKAPLADYHKTTGRPSSAAALRRSIELLMHGGVAYEFRTTVIKSLLSPEDLAQIAQEIKGAKAYYLQKFVPTTILNPQFKRKVTYTDDDFTEFQKQAAHHVEYCGIR